jgi:hypothetical protein
MHFLKRHPKPRVVIPEDFGRVDAEDQWGIQIRRGRQLLETVHHGPNVWTAIIQHADGTWEPAIQGHNLLTNSGRDLIAAAYGAPGQFSGTNVATGSSATSLTDTGESWTTDQFKGWTVIAEESTNTPVYGNVGSNTATVLTIDAWRNNDDTSGTTPGSTANYAVYPTMRARYMGLTENASAASATDTVLTGEITTGGCNRQLATYAHTGGTSTYTMVKSFSVTASFPAIHKGALFTASNTTAAGIMTFEAVLNADANVINGDTLQVTATVTLS